jgi:hypothetical protein
MRLRHQSAGGALLHKMHVMRRAGAFYETYREAWHLLKEPQATETPEHKKHDAANSDIG